MSATNRSPWRTLLERDVAEIERPGSATTQRSPVSW
jgi:hypothetical protein